MPLEVVLADGTSLGPPAQRETLFVLAGACAAGWSVIGTAKGLVRLTPVPGVTFLARWSIGFDVDNASEVFKDRVYAAVVRDRLVVDIGANNGDSTLFFASEGASDVIALEPNPDSFALARRNVDASPWQGRITLLSVAAGTYDGSADLRLPRSVPNAASLSPAPAAEARWPYNRSIVVPVRSLDGVLLGAAPRRIGLLKVDCQGSEYDLLGSVSSSGWAQVDAIVLEFTGGARDLPERLRAFGFEVEADAGQRGYLRAHRGQSGSVA